MILMHPARAAFTVSMLIFVLVGMTVLKVLQMQGRKSGPALFEADWRVFFGLVITMWSWQWACGNSLPLPLMYWTFATMRALCRIQ